MLNKYILRQEDLVDNPTARVPICLVLDVSGSMEGRPIGELNEGVRLFFDAVKADEVAQYGAEICIVTFGGAVEKRLDFMAIDRQDIPQFTAGGATPMGEAVNTALDLLDARKEDYKRAGVDYYQPWMVLMTDGEPTDSIDEASKRVAAAAGAKKLTVFPIGIGPEAKLDKLAQLSGGRAPVRLRELNFREFFVWLSRSVSKVSQSTPGDAVKLDTDGMKSWANI